MHGGSRVIGQLIERLARRHEVGGAVHADRSRGPARGGCSPAACSGGGGEPTRPPVDRTQAHCRSRACRGSLLAGRPAWVGDWAVPAFAARAREIVREWRPDVVQAEFHLMGQYLAALWTRDPRSCMVEHEPGVVATADRAARESGARGLARRIDGRAWRRYERRILRSADAVVAFTEEDRAVLADLEPSARIVRIPPGVALPRSRSTRLERTLRAFSSWAISHTRRISRPRLTSQSGSSRRSVRVARRQRSRSSVSARPGELRRISQPGVVVVGSVSDVSGYLDRAAVVAVPTRLGGGIRVKVLETLAAGKALVATSRALAGIDLVPGEQAMVAETDDEFADAVVELLREPRSARAPRRAPAAPGRARTCAGRTRWTPTRRCTRRSCPWIARTMTTR